MAFALLSVTKYALDLSGAKEQKPDEKSGQASKHSMINQGRMLEYWKDMDCESNNLMPKRKALFIGGTGTISSAVTELVARDDSWELWLLNRGNRRNELPENVHCIIADINDEQSVLHGIEDLHFDCVCDFIAFKPEQVERDFRLFSGRTEQYIFISSASAYQKPVRDFHITEETPLDNPFWQYSRDKKACEEYLFSKWREEAFPVTIVRPSHTYGDRSVPVGIHGKNGSWQVLQRMIEGKEVIVHGDGQSLWTMTRNSDFARGFVPLMGCSAAIGEAFHITSDESLTWDNIYGTVAKILGVELKIKHIASDFLAEAGKEYDLKGSLLGDKANTVVFDNSKLRRIAAPDFKAVYSYEQGVRKTIDYIMRHPELQKPDPDFDSWCDRVIALYDGLSMKND